MSLAQYDIGFYPEVAFGGLSRSDGAVQFYSRVNTLIRSDSVLVDFGCGRGQHVDDPVPFRRSLRNFRGKVAQVIGLDVDPVGANNPTVDRFFLLNPGCAWPVGDESVDVIICDCVLEHLPEPAFFFAEARRTLRSGGFLCIATTNVFSYVGIASKIVPNRFHSRILARAQADRKLEDVFPTVYRCNTIPSIRRQLARNGFQAAVFGFDAGPGYLTFSRLAYAIGYLHQQVAPSLIRPIIMAFGRKSGLNPVAVQYKPTGTRPEHQPR
jgi:SAM-dependent methyltransferase